MWFFFHTAWCETNADCWVVGLNSFRPLQSHFSSFTLQFQSSPLTFFPDIFLRWQDSAWKRNWALVQGELHTAMAHNTEGKLVTWPHYTDFSHKLHLCKVLGETIKILHLISSWFWIPSCSLVVDSWFGLLPLSYEAACLLYLLLLPRNQHIKIFRSKPHYQFIQYVILLFC